MVQKAILVFVSGTAKKHDDDYRGDAEQEDGRKFVAVVSVKLRSGQQAGARDVRESAGAKGQRAARRDGMGVPSTWRYGEWTGPTGMNARATT